MFPITLLAKLLQSLTAKPATVARSPVQPQKPTVAPLPPKPVAISADRFVEIAPSGHIEQARPAITVSFGYETSGTAFLKEAQRLRGREDGATAPVPFMQYWPTYGVMDSAQQRWYFYWRAQARRSNFLPTDLSYIFVHIYELLNLVELANAADAAARLKLLWQTYRPQHPKLDNYVPEWSGDLLAVKANVPTALDWWFANVPDNARISPAITNAILQRHVQAGTLDKIPYSLWVSLMNYRPRNKFYLEYNINGEIDRGYEKAIRVATEFWTRTSGQSLLEKFTSPKLLPARKPVFTSALIGYNHPPEIDLGSSRNFLGEARLGEHLTAVVKYAENILRKQKGFSRKLSGITLDQALIAALDSAFAPPVEVPKPLRITIDPARVAALHQQSEQIGALLEITAAQIPPPAKPLYTDLAEVRALWATIEAPDRMMIASIFRQEATTLNQLSIRLAASALLPNMAVDRVNEHALKLLGDRLVYTEPNDRVSLAEDFLDELDVVIAESPPESQLTLSKADLNEATLLSESGDSWELLFAKLTPVEIALIGAFTEAGSLSETKIAEIAQPYQVMANLALDLLNEKSLDALGHPLTYLDGDHWSVEPDDLPQLQRHLLGHPKG